MRTSSRHASAAMALLAFAMALRQPWTLIAQDSRRRAQVPRRISPADLKEWLSYLASDTLQGRQVFSEGYGLAAAYIAERLRGWGVKPAGDEGTYFENVRLRGYRVTRNSSVTVTARAGSPGRLQTRRSRHVSRELRRQADADVRQRRVRGVWTGGRLQGARRQEQADRLGPQPDRGNGLRARTRRRGSASRHMGRRRPSAS